MNIHEGGYDIVNVLDFVGYKVNEIEILKNNF